MSEEYSVVAFFNDGDHVHIVRRVDEEKAVTAFRNCVRVAEHPLAINPPRRIITTDGTHTIAEWMAGKGLLVEIG
jgi:hypothetical protein